MSLIMPMMSFSSTITEEEFTKSYLDYLQKNVAGLTTMNQCHHSKPCKYIHRKDWSSVNRFCEHDANTQMDILKNFKISEVFPDYLSAIKLFKEPISLEDTLVSLEDTLVSLEDTLVSLERISDYTIFPEYRIKEVSKDTSHIIPTRKSHISQNCPHTKKCMFILGAPYCQHKF